MGDCRVAAPTDFIRATSVGKLDFFRLDFVSVSDERRSVINDYLWYRRDGAETAKNAKNIPKFIPGDKKDVLMSFHAIFDP